MSQSLPDSKKTKVHIKKRQIQVSDRGQKNEWLFRAFDLVLGGIGIIFFSPVLLITFFLVKLENPKVAAIFKQERVKKNGERFNMYKFRSMSVDAESQFLHLIDKNNMSGPMFKIADDPRITKVGKVIRKLSIDEFPQLINVIRGDMALVGPRPPLPLEVAAYTENDLQRLAIKPGCTGLWQVSGRNKLSFKEMLALDLYYIEHRSLKLNLVIILKTFKELTFLGGGM